MVYPEDISIWKDLYLDLTLNHRIGEYRDFQTWGFIMCFCGEECIGGPMPVAVHNWVCHVFMARYGLSIQTLLEMRLDAARGNNM